MGGVTAPLAAHQKHAEFRRCGKQTTQGWHQYWLCNTSSTHWQLLHIRTCTRSTTLYCKLPVVQVAVHTHHVIRGHIHTACACTRAQGCVHAHMGSCWDHDQVLHLNKPRYATNHAEYSSNIRCLKTHTFLTCLMQQWNTHVPGCVQPRKWVGVWACHTAAYVSDLHRILPQKRLSL